MKLNGVIKCPLCDSTNTLPFNAYEITIEDDSVYERISSKKKYPAISATKDNIIYHCFCKDCENYFTSLTIIKAEITDAITCTDVEAGKLFIITDKQLKDIYNNEG